MLRSESSITTLSKIPSQWQILRPNRLTRWHTLPNEYLLELWLPWVKPITSGIIIWGITSTALQKIHVLLMFWRIHRLMRNRASCLIEHNTHNARLDLSWRNATHFDITIAYWEYWWFDYVFPEAKWNTCALYRPKISVAWNFSFVIINVRALKRVTETLCWDRTSFTVYNLKKMYMVLTKINTSVYRDFCWHEYNYLIHFNFLYKTFRQKKKKNTNKKKERLTENSMKKASPKLHSLLNMRLTVRCKLCYEFLVFRALFIFKRGNE